MGVTEAVTAMGDCFGTASDGFVVQPGVGLRPVQVSAHEHLTPLLPIVSNPGHALEVACCSND